MSFHNYLHEKIHKDKLSRKNIINDLSYYNEEFYCLDAITFSRWINGRTNPSIYKQILICYFLNDSVYMYLKELRSHISTPKSFTLRMNKIFEAIEREYSSILYNVNQDDESSFVLKKLTDKEYDKEFRTFFSNFTSYKDIYEKHINLKKERTIYSIQEIKDESITSHVNFFVYDGGGIGIVNDLFGLNIVENNSKVLIIDISFYRSQESYKRLISIFIKFIFDNNLEECICFSISRGRDFLHLFESIGFDQVGSYIPDKNCNIYLLKYPFLKLMSHPYYIKLINS
ncbi:hypothetical protein [Photobacterium damselae]|uniref:hypothetical protein n=1 Tax=Photobacterium damselae TaxID=38293 RepID=UPI000D069444|nr:hypothetical protein [Photobacterium damselae]PSB84767.1 hypothetical protein C5F62_05525 [Photobacterium damselae subsp. damselae]